LPGSGDNVTIAKQDSLKGAIAMNERERILDLVKQGIISTEEALTLLENSAKTQSNVEQQKMQQEQADQHTASATADQADTIASQLADVQATLAKRQTALQTAEEHLQVLDTMADLDGLTAEKQTDRDETALKITELQTQISELADEKARLKKLAAQEQPKRQQHHDHWSDKWNLDDEWKENAADTFSQVGEKVGEAGNQLGKFLKNTAQTIMDNVDWKEINVKVPGLVTSHFDHDFVYEAATASILDVKLANGNISFETWDQPDIKVSAHVKMYGKFEEADDLEAFLQRSEIGVTADTLTFKVPNKRIMADLTFYLPKRRYDHTAVKVLNGNVQFKAFQGEDLYVKSTSGNLSFDELDATMLEVEGVNGNIHVTGGQLVDTLLNTVNGEVYFASQTETAELTTVNGSVRATIRENTLKRLNASSVNGTVKLAVPTDLALNGETSTRFGAIKSRLSAVDVLNEQQQTGHSFYNFERDLATEPAELKLTTASGNILLKDTKD
jgi:DUF4097 and DUF4098 domain-containing protein YvlB